MGIYRAIAPTHKEIKQEVVDPLTCRYFVKKFRDRTFPTGIFRSTLCRKANNVWSGAAVA
jgi:hypothetical protein